MRSAPVLVLLLVLFACVGCAPGRPWEQAGARQIVLPDTRPVEASADSKRSPSSGWTGHITAYAAMHPDLPNAYLQLPRVSADGRWIAYLRRADSGAAVTSDSLIHGKGLQGVSLWVRSTDGAVEPKVLAVSGACWPAWSRDSGRLAFVTYDQARGCGLCIYDPADGVIQRKAVGLKHMLMPAVGPSGRVAVSAYGETPDDALIFIIDTETTRATPGPPAEHGAQIYPRWITPDTILYLELADGAAFLKRWSLGSDKATTLARFPAPGSIFDAQHLLTGIAEPLRPDIGAYALYNMWEGRVELLSLESMTTRRSPVGFRGGAWWGDDWFIAGSSDRVELVSSLRANGETDEPRMMRLLTGRWLPIWADGDQQAVLLIGESDTPDRFKLMHVWLIAGHED